MKKRILSIALASTLLASTTLLVVPKPARAFFATSFEAVVEEMLGLMSTNMTTLTTTVLRLSDDIGTMSDRIGIMADRILVMSDNIGIMADRIVTTEQLMADLVRDVTDSQGPSALVVSPTEGELVSLTSPLDISLSTGSIDYVLFMSNSSDMEGATNILVQNGNTSPATERAAAYASGSQLYIAVKAINNDTIGPISNTVMVNIAR